MKSARSLCLVFLLILGPTSSFARTPENSIEIKAEGQYADFQFTLPNGTKGGIDPVARKELPGEIVYDNSYLGDITGKSNDPSRSRASFCLLGNAEFGKYELSFFQKKGQKEHKLRTISIYVRAHYFPNGIGKGLPTWNLSKEVKLGLPPDETCAVRMDYKLDSDTKTLAVDFSSPCLVK